MEYKSVEQLAQLARVDAAPSRPLTQVDRLERWAQLLAANPDRHLHTLFRTEYRFTIDRDAMRAADSPISVAFADPVLRGDGLADDSYGAAKRFFALDDRQLHHVLCYCHYGATLSARTAARAVRRVLDRITDADVQVGLISRLRRMFGSYPVAADANRTARVDDPRE